MNKLKLNAEKQSFSGLGPNTVLPCLAAVDRHSSLEQRPSKPVTMCVCSESPSSDLSLDKHVSTIQRFSTGSVRSAEYVDHSTQTPQRLLYTLSLRLVSTTVTPRWLGCQGPSPTGFNGRSTRLSEWSVEPGSLIAACPNCFTPSYIGWTFHNVSSINSESQFIGVCRLKLLRT